MTAFSWDIDLASMVKKLGEPFKGHYMASYVMPTLHIHATLASAFSTEGVRETPEERNIAEAEATLIYATLALILVIRSQSEIFGLHLDDESTACWDEVALVWNQRPHSSAPRGVSAQS